MPASALAMEPTAPLREATAGAQAGDVQEQVTRTRETEDLMWRMRNYRTLECENCGTKLRLPPTYNAPSVRCPHCGHINDVP